MKKIVSMLLTMIMLCGMIGIMPVNAASGEEVVYKHVDLTPYATGKFWVNPTDSSETLVSQYPSFFNYLDTGNGMRIAAEYPLAFRSGLQREDNGAYGSKYPPQQAIIENTASATYVSSKRSGVTYKMPVKTETADGKEAVCFNHFRAYNYASKNDAIKEITINESGKYSSLHFLVASSALSDSGSTMSAVVTYTDNSKSNLTSAPLPAGGYEGQTANNFVADIARLASDGTNFTSSAAAADSANRAISLYEYSLELDKTKTVKSINISTERSYGYPTIALTSVTLEGSSSDINKEIISYQNHDLSSVANGKWWMYNSDAEKEPIQYDPSDFASKDSVSKIAARWPFQFSDNSHREGNGSYGKDYRPQNGVITGNETDGYTITSNSTGVPYKMPAKTDTVAKKEAIVLNRYFTDAKKEGYIRDAQLSVSGNYDSLHFLVGAYIEDEINSATITARVTYTNGDTDELTGAVIPASTQAGQNGADNFVADIYGLGIANAGDSTATYGVGYRGGYSTARILALYEYSLKLDPDKTVESVYFITDRSGMTPSIAIVSVMTKSVTQDTTISNGFECKNASVANGAVSVDMCAPMDGKAILAVYDAEGKKLIATGSLDLSGSVHGGTVKAENESIVAGGAYKAKLFVWNSLTGLVPVYKSADIVLQ